MLKKLMAENGLKPNGATSLANVYTPANTSSNVEQANGLKSNGNATQTNMYDSTKAKVANESVAFRKTPQPTSINPTQRNLGIDAASSTVEDRSKAVRVPQSNQFMAFRPDMFAPGENLAGPLYVHPSGNDSASHLEVDVDGTLYYPIIEPTEEYTYMGPEGDLYTVRGEPFKPLSISADYEGRL